MRSRFILRFSHSSRILSESRSRKSPLSAGHSGAIGSEHQLEHRWGDYGRALLGPHQQVFIPRDYDSGSAVSRESNEDVRVHNGSHRTPGGSA